MSTTINIDPAPPVSPEDRTVAIVSYITLIGFIVAIILHGNKKTALGAYHLRQTLGLVIGGVVLGVVAIVPLIGWAIALLGWLLLFVMWLMGIIAAATGQMKPAPILGAQFQQWFANTF